jgi:phenylacetate-coenzyme A ligase PaaK-like adenylate-forming protein
VSNPCYVPHSKVPGIVWPALGSRPATEGLALLYQLEQSQWWPIERLRGMQLLQLQHLTRHAYEHVPYYRRAWSDAGFSPDAPLTWDRWRQLPILTRATLQESAKALLSRRAPESHGRVFTVSSSGSTGRPVAVNKSLLCEVFRSVLVVREHFWQRRDLSGTFLHIRYSDEPASRAEGHSRPSYWGSLTREIFPTGPACLLHSSTDLARQAQWLAGHAPDYLMTYPSNARALAIHFREHGLTLPGLREVLTFGEAMGEGTRQACRDAWNVRVTDCYSAQEIGYITLQCPTGEHYHTMAESVLVEVLDDDGRACGPGQTGRVVVTPLHNFIMPLVRYELGDYAEVGGPCGCGRGLPVLTRVVGRGRGLIRLPDGRRYRPSVSIVPIARIAPVRAAQIFQREIDHVEVRLVCSGSLDHEQLERVTECVRAGLGYPMRITFSYHDDLPRGPTDKFEDFVCLLDDNPGHDQRGELSNA